MRDLDRLKKNSTSNAMAEKAVPQNGTEPSRRTLGVPSLHLNVRPGGAIKFLVEGAAAGTECFVAARLATLTVLQTTLLFRP
jgi:hypothetical protein